LKILEDDDCDSENKSPQRIIPQMTPLLPAAPNFKPSFTTKNNQQLPPPIRNSCHAGNKNTLPDDPIVSAVNQILSTSNPSGKWKGPHSLSTFAMI
jgi:hypothetical protein